MNLRVKKIVKPGTAQNSNVMISQKMKTAINEQINAELWSAYLYLSMSLYAEAKALKGIANWFFVQWMEEQDHARIFQNWILSQDEKVTLMPIEGVPSEWPSVLEMFRDTLSHEKEVTAMIRNLVKLALAESDYATLSRLQWFIDEQVEEEQAASDVLTLLERAATFADVYAIDKDLAERRYEKPDLLE